MAVTTEQVQVNVEINGQKAGTTLKDLQATAKSLRTELRNLPTDTDEFTKKAAELQKVNTQLKAINDSVKAIDKSMEDAGEQGGKFSSIMEGALSVFTGGGLKDLAEKGLEVVKDFFVDSVEGAKKAAAANAQLETALHGNVQATEELKTQAEDLEKSLRGVFDEEDIKNAQTHLALYTQESDQIKQLTPQILDLAAAKGVDLTTAADAVGKSLEGDGDALKKLGISTKGAATEQERFTIISEGLTEKVGGQAKALSDAKTTGWDALKVTFEEFSKSVGAKLLPIINQLGDFLVQLWDNSKPVVDVFKTIFGVFGQVWDSIKQLIASFGLFSEKGSFAKQVMQGLAFTLKPMQIAWQLISKEIKIFSTVLNEVVAGANGTVQALVAIFNNFKTFFSNLFGGIGDVIKGVFTFDYDKIKEGLEGMKAAYTTMGGQIADAYNNGYTDVRNRQKAAIADQDEQDHKKEVETAAKKGTATAKAEGDANAKQKQKNKEKQDKQDAADAQEALRKQADLQNKLKELYDQVATIQVNAMQDGTDKQIAQENLRFQHEKDQQAKRMNQLRLDGADEQEIQQQNFIWFQNAEKEHENKLTDIQIQAKAKQKQIDDQAAEQKKKDLETAFKTEEEATNQFYGALANAIKKNSVDRITAEQTTTEQIQFEKEKADYALLQLEIAKNEQLLVVQKKYGQDTTQTESEIQNEKMDLAQRTATFKEDLEKEMVDITKQSLDLAIGFLSQDEAARKKNAQAIKAFSISQVLIDLEQEIQAIWKTANASPTNILFPGSGNIIAGVKTALAVGRATLAVAKIQKQQFASGGYTGDDGVSIFSAANEPPVAGVVHTNEWVAPAWMVTHPVYNSYINNLEKARRRGYANGGFTTINNSYFNNLAGIRQRGFADGGFTTTPVTNVSTSLDLMGTENKLDQLIKVFQAFPQRLKADVVYTDFETVQQNVNDVRNAAQVGQ